MIVQLFDTETTGLVGPKIMPLEKQPYITEFFSHAVDLATGEVLWELEMLIKPPVPISAEITKITGITDELLADAPSFADVAPLILSAIMDGPRMVAHNASFDMDMLWLEFKRTGHDLQFPARPICTVEKTISMKGHRLNLTKLHTLLFGEGFPAAHRARNDVLALTRCAVELFKRGYL